MKSKSGRKFLLKAGIAAVVILSSGAAIWAARSAPAPVTVPAAATSPATYSYIGSPLSNCTGAYVGCDGGTRVTGWMTLPDTLSANLLNAVVQPIDYRFTDGRGASLGAADAPAFSFFPFSTDQSGSITRWTMYLGTTATDGCMTDNVLIGSYFVPFSDLAGDYSCYLIDQNQPTQSWGAGQNQNQPGVWRIQAATTSCAAVPTGLTHWWPGQTGAGDIIGGDHGTVFGTVTHAPGYIGEAFQFGNGHLRLGQTYGGPGTAEITVMAWINTQQTGPDLWQAIFSSTDSSFVHFQTAAAGGSAVYPDLSFSQIPSFGPTPVGTWRHVALTAQSGRILVYENGAIVGQTTPTFTHISQATNGVLIGAGYQNGRRFPGLVDELQVYNRALTATEVNGVFNAGSAGFCPGYVADGNVSGLIAAILAANARPGPDTITLATNGRYELVTNYDATNGLPSITGALTINGNGASIVRSASSSTPEFRIVTINTGQPTDVVALSSLILGNGKGSGDFQGGAIRKVQGSLVINDSIIYGSRAAWGGGLWNYKNGSLAITNSYIGGNAADDPAQGGAGGGFYNYEGAVAVTNSVIDRNLARNSGGIFNYQGPLTMVDSIVSANATSPNGNGGGVTALNGTVDITGGLITGNTARDGAGIFNSGTVTIQNATISGNTAAIKGGGIYGQTGSTLTVRGSTISGNIAHSSAAPTSGYGGGIFNWSGATATISNSTIAANQTNFAGGGVYNNGALTLLSTTIFGNTSAQYAGGLASDSGATTTLANTLIAGSTLGKNCHVFGPPIISLGHNLGEGPTCAPYFNQVGDLANLVAGMDPAGLSDNGGPTLTVGLAAGSPARDAGDDTRCSASPVNGTDQRGTARPLGAHCDIGAFEATPIDVAQAIVFTSTPPSPALVGTTYQASATGGGSGNPVVFSSMTPVTCTVAGDTVAMHHVGACSIAANQAAAPGFTAAPQVSQTFNVVPSAEPRTWVNVTSNGPVPPARAGHRMVYDSTRHKVIMFGGQTTEGCCGGEQNLTGIQLNDMWEWDGSTFTWSEVFPSSGPTPAPRSFHGMTYDPVRDRVVLYGGKRGAVYYATDGETWEWDPGARSWQFFPGATTLDFAGRRGSMLAFDPNLGQVILFGGEVYWGEKYGNTWVWENNNWTQLPIAGPSGRTQHTLTTDFARSRVVLYGGDTASSTPGDTWEWNGSAWTQVSASPLAQRVDSGAAYDPFYGQTVLYGGDSTNAGTLYNTTFGWAGSAWSPIATAATPPALETVLAFDGTHVVLFGGRGTSGTTNQTWVLAPISTAPRFQTISFTSVPPSLALAGGTYVVSANGGGSGNPVLFSSLSVSCSVSGSLVSLIGPGTCVIAANQDAGSGYNAAAQVTQSFSIWQPGAVASVSAGGYTTCAVGEDGAVNCWGSAQYAPVPASLISASQVSTGYSHACAVQPNGNVVCWGDNTFGQTAVPATAVPALSVSSGGYHSCAVRTDGATVCWGYNNFGQRNVPAGLGSVAEVSAGLFHTCARRPDGSVACWGLNDRGQGTVPAGLSATQVSSGGMHTCALRGDGSVSCWGYNAFGPTSVPAGLTATQVASGGFHTCAVRSSGTVSCWGGNGYNQEVVPASLVSVQQVTTGYGHTCALRSSGQVTCWGDNFFGQATPPAGLDVIPGSHEQFMTFTTTPPNPAIVGTAYIIGATGGGSGNPVVFTSLTPGVCTVSGNSAALVAAGTCAIAADQAGGAGYTAAPQIQQSFAVSSMPSLNVPSNMTVEATSPSGAVATFQATAVDPADTSPTVSCSPASATVFPLGSTNVSCTATNRFGNSVSSGFTVLVRDTIAPVLVGILYPSVDHVLSSSHQAVIVLVTDAVGVSGVTVNGVPASLNFATVVNGQWLAEVPVTPFAVATLNVSVEDAAHNTSGGSLTIDSDGIARDIDRARLNYQQNQESTFTNDFNDGRTSGTLGRAGGFLTARPWNMDGSAAVLIEMTSLNGGAANTASLCGGVPKSVRLDAPNEYALVQCIPGATAFTPPSLKVRAGIALPTIEVYKERRSCTLGCRTLTDRYTLKPGQTLTTGSPAAASPDNTEPIQVDIIRTNEDGSEEIIGAYVLDPGETVDMEVVPGATAADDEIVFTVLAGEVTVTLGDDIVTVGEGETIEALVTQRAQSIAFAAIDNQLFGATPIALGGTATSGLPVSYTAAGMCSVTGGQLSINGVGSCSVTATQAGDLSYLPAQPVTRTFSISHAWSGLLQPVNMSGDSVFKRGSTVPLKFVLTGGSAAITTLVARVYIAKTSNQVVGTEVEAATGGNADQGNVFRYDASSGQYHFNWGTKDLSEGTWQIRVDLGDGNGTRVVLVSLKK